MHRWKFSALATAAALSVGLYASDASALALGRVNVQSALGEPLRAEIELPQITPAEAESLRVAPASPEVFRAQGMEYSPAAHNVQVQLHRRPDGSAVLRLSSNRPINDPFVDLVIDATWNSGHIVRSYTMLFDPPATRRPQANVTVPAQVAAAPRPEAAPPAQPAPRAPAVASPAPRPAPAPAPAPVRAPAAETATGSGTIAVRPGDTAGRIASTHRPAGVSLDQMLVAMTQANPDAFIQGNVNRLRAGAVLRMPSEADAQATPAAEAHRIVAAQSRDFNEFRRRMAGVAPKAEVASAERSARGTVQAQVDESKPSAPSPDKLTLSKGSVQTSQADEQIAREKQANQDAARMAELSKNISDLKELSGASAQAGAGSAPGAAAVPAPAGVPASASTEPPAEPASAPAQAASAPVAAPKPPAQPAPAAYEAPGFLDTLMEDPLLSGGALALVLALLGYGGYRAVQHRRNQAAMDTSFESRLQPDSFFGVSGGQRVDTANSDLATGSSSMTYSPSQLDAGGDVDPVAEADVYLAYGRDLQAEEILKEALRHHPDRVSIPAKLAEIYAKRQDRKGLEAVADDVFKLTNGQGPDWNRVADLGRTLDPDNLLYQPGGRPAGLPGGLAATAAAAGFAGTLAAASAPAPLAPSAGPDSVLPDLDLDLDLHEAPPAPPSPPSAFAAAAAATAAQASQEPAPAPADSHSPLDLDLDGFDLPNASWDVPAPPASAPPAPATEPAMIEPSPLDLQDSGLSPLEFDATQPPGDAPAPSAPMPLEFDLGGLSLDLGTPPASQPAPVVDPLPDDPLATKLALAEEFMAIGDDEGARTLVEEVVAESSGELKARAQRLLGELG